LKRGSNDHVCSFRQKQGQPLGGVNMEENFFEDTSEVSDSERVESQEEGALAKMYGRTRRLGKRAYTTVGGGRMRVKEL